MQKSSVHDPKSASRLLQLPFRRSHGHGWGRTFNEPGLQQGRLNTKTDLSFQESNIHDLIWTGKLSLSDIYNISYQDICIIVAIVSKISPSRLADVGMAPCAERGSGLKYCQKSSQTAMILKKSFLKLWTNATTFH
jgi:hypothetical protein